MTAVGQPPHPTSADSVSAGISRGAAVPSPPADAHLVEATRNEIRGIVNEITRLSRCEMPLDQFYEALLRNLVSALAAHGGAIWSLVDGQLQLNQQINFPRAQLLDSKQDNRRHSDLLRQVVTGGKPRLIPPGYASETDPGANPTDTLILAHPLLLQDRVVAIIEIFQRADGGPASQRGYLRFLTDMGELATNFLQTDHLRSLVRRDDLWREVQQFALRTQRSLDTRETCFAIANEGRRILGVDRVSLAVSRGGRCKIEAVSGVDNVDCRAEEVRQLSQLADGVLRTGEALWYDGPTELPPQIERPLDSYIDRAHTKSIAVMPLARMPLDDDHPVQDDRPCGALILERFSDELDNDVRQRVDLISKQSAAALANTLDHQSVFLLPVWQTIGRWHWLARTRAVPKLLAAAVLVALAVTAMTLVPADFDLSASGKLLPVSRHEVFAPQDGIVQQVLVSHGKTVHPGDEIARLYDADLELAIRDLMGQQAVTRQQLAATEEALNTSRRLSPVDDHQLFAQREQLAQKAESLQQQLALYRQKQANLIVRNSHAGQVVTWQIERKLSGRPIRRGQVLATVVDPKQDWELELYLPERSAGHLADALSSSERPLPVTFMLTSRPGRDFRGHVSEVDPQAEVRDEYGNCLLVRVAIDKEALPELHHGASVNARLKCGQRAIGYTWFRELIETVQTKLMFWL